MQLIIIIKICIKLLISIAGAISNLSFLKVKTANNIFKKGIFTIHSNSYIVKRIPIIDWDFKI